MCTLYVNANDSTVAGVLIYISVSKSIPHYLYIQCMGVELVRGYQYVKLIKRALDGYIFNADFVAQSPQ